MEGISELIGVVFKKMTLAVEWIGREQSGFKETSCKATQLLVRSDGGLGKEVAVEEVRKSTQK